MSAPLRAVGLRGARREGARSAAPNLSDARSGPPGSSSRPPPAIEAHEEDPVVAGGRDDGRARVVDGEAGRRRDGPVKLDADHAVRSRAPIRSPVPVVPHEPHAVVPRCRDEHVAVPLLQRRRDPHAVADRRPLYPALAKSAVQRAVGGVSQHHGAAVARPRRQQAALGIPQERRDAGATSDRRVHRARSPETGVQDPLPGEAHESDSAIVNRGGDHWSPPAIENHAGSLRPAVVVVEKIPARVFVASSGRKDV